MEEKPNQTKRKKSKLNESNLQLYVPCFTYHTIQLLVKCKPINGSAMNAIQLKKKNERKKSTKETLDTSGNLTNLSTKIE